MSNSRLYDNALNWVNRMAPSVFFMGMIFYFSSMPAGDVIQSSGRMMTLASRVVQWLALGFPVEINWLKVGHFIGYFGLGWAYRHALTGSIRRPGMWAILLTAAFAVSDEIHQTFTAGRSASIIDIFLDTAAALLAITALHLVTHSQVDQAKKRKAPECSANVTASSLLDL